MPEFLTSPEVTLALMISVIILPFCFHVMINRRDARIKILTGDRVKHANRESELLDATRSHEGLLNAAEAREYRVRATLHEISRIIHNIDDRSFHDVEGTVYVVDLDVMRKLEDLTKE